MPRSAKKVYIGELLGKKRAAETKRKINKLCGPGATMVRRDPSLKIFYAYRVYVPASCLRRHSARSLIRKVR